ncbi:class I SAM-dependent methyltransferase [Sorangium sp. So ce388]|uniref:class I SAM-dependent methyltransferase n=1 Tax=Sorangium sp. So ce388 TaxID=3133309 RepID=UPI003F5C8037
MRSPIALVSLALAALTGCASAPPAAPAAPAAAPDAAPATAPAAPSAPTAATPQAPSRVTSVEVPPALRAVVDAADRAEADRALDAGRKPAETLAFFGIQPGMKVAEIEAGGGYTAELLARAVGPGGAVYAQNNRFVLERFAEKPWSERLKKPVMKAVVRVDRELDDPLPPEARDLDAVFLILFYHDTVWMEVDRAAMNRAIFRALKPGGVFAIIDHSGRDGTGVTEVKTLHRIEEKVVREEIERAGFRLAAEATFLRTPTDTRDWNASPTAAGEKRGTSDRFVLKFVKPGG